MYTAGDDGFVRVWDVATGAERRTLGGESSAYSLATSPDGGRLACGKAAEVILWNATTGKELGRLKGGDKHRYLRVAFSPDGKLLASGGVDGQVVLWDVATTKEVRCLPVADGWQIVSLAFSPDGSQLAVSCDIPGGPAGSGKKADDLLRVWDVARGREVRRLSARSGGHIAFSPDGRFLAGEYSRVWDLATGASLQRRTVADDLSPCFSPDGRLIASGNRSGEVILTEAVTGAERRRFVGHRGGVYALAFAPDGRTLATSGADTTVLVWDVRAPVGKPRADLKQQELEELLEALGRTSGRATNSRTTTPDDCCAGQTPPKRTTRSSLWPRRASRW